MRGRGGVERYARGGLPARCGRGCSAAPAACTRLIIICSALLLALTLPFSLLLAIRWARQG